MIPVLHIDYNKKFFILLFLAFLFFMNIFIGSFFWDVSNTISVVSDETVHLSVARSFINGENFLIGYIPSFLSDEFTVNQIIETDQDYLGPYNRPIIFHIFLGSFLSIFNIQYDEQLFYSSIFSNVLGSIFLVIFFITVKKLFNLQTAIFTSLILMTCNYTVFYTLRPIPIGLFLVFASASLLFLEKKNFHFAMFGALIGLAHMNAADALLLGTSYIVILLAQKKFRGATIVFLIWNVTLIPIYLRNFYIHKDVGVGLYIPFSNIVSELFNFLPSETEKFNTSNIFLREVDFSRLISFESFYFDSIENLFSFHFGYFLFSLIIIAIVILFIYYVRSRFNSSVDFKSISLFKKFPEISYLIILFLSISVLSNFYLSYTSNFEFFAGNKHIIFSLFLLVALFIFGIGKTIDKISEYRIYILKISTIVLVILTSSSIVDSVYGLTMMDDPSRMRHYTQSQLNEIEQMIDWESKHIPTDTIISSNNSGDQKLRTGLTSIMIPSDLSCKNLDKYLTHFNIKYVIWYHKDITHSSQELIFSAINHSKYKFEKVFDSEVSEIYEIKLRENILNDVKNQLYVITQFEYQNDLNIHLDMLDFYEFMLNFDNQVIPYFCDVNKSDYELQNDFRIQMMQDIDFRDLSKIYFETSFFNSLKTNIDLNIKNENIEEILLNYDRLIRFYETAKSNPFSDWRVFSTNQINFLFEAADFYKMYSFETKELRIYEKILEIDYDNVRAWLGKAELLEDYGFFTQAIDAYENALRVDSEHHEKIQKKLIELKNFPR